MNFLNRILGRKQVNFDWADEYRDNDGWRTVRNPELDATRQQKISRIVLGLVLLSLPFSLGSCLFVFAVSQGTDDTPEAPPAYTHPWEPIGHAYAEQGARLWLENSGRDVLWIRSLYANESNLQCGGVFCEQHAVAAYLPEGQVITVGVLVDPADGTLVTAPYLLAWDTPSDTPNGPSEMPSDDQVVQGPTWETWSTMADKTGIPDMDAVETVLEEWAKAWVAGDQNELRNIAGLPTSAGQGGQPPQEFWTPPTGFDYVLDSIDLVDWADLGDADGTRVATVSLEVLPAEHTGCTPIHLADGDDENVCPRKLVISADIRIVAKEFLNVRVVAVSPTGNGGLETTPVLPTVGDDLWRGGVPL